MNGATNNHNHKKEVTEKIVYVEDDRLSVRRLLSLRLPALIIGFFLGLGLSFVVSGFEEVLNHDIRLVFFLPFVVYISQAFGGQAQAIAIRDFSRGKAVFKNYLVKELGVGFVSGIIFAMIALGFIYVWLGSLSLALTVASSLFVTVFIAPVLGMTITRLIQLGHKDPAVASGPLGTVIQDTISVIIYGFLANLIMFNL